MSIRRDEVSFGAPFERERMSIVLVGKGLQARFEKRECERGRLWRGGVDVVVDAEVDVRRVRRIPPLDKKVFSDIPLILIVFLVLGSAFGKPDETATKDIVSRYEKTKLCQDRG